MDKIINPLDGEMDLLGDTKSDIVRKLNPLNGRLEVVYKSDSYIQKINPFIGDFDMVGGTGASYIIKEATGSGYINLTNAVANHLMELKAYGGTEQDLTPTPTTPVDIVCNNGTIKFSKNMANVNEQTIQLGYYISSSGVITADANNRIYKEFIPVQPNTTYTLTLSSSVYFVSISEYSTAEDSGFVVRKAGSTGSNTQLTITTGATTNYVKFGTNIDRTEITLEEVLAINWMLNQGDTMPYTPYSPTGIYTDGTTETVNVHRKNLFDQSTATKYKTAWSNSGDGAWQVVLSSSEAVAYGSYVRPNTTYTLSKKGGSRLIITGYRTKTEPSSEQTTPADYKIKTDTTEVVDGSYTFTTPADCTWILFGLRQNNSTPTFPYDVQLELGSTATTYEPYYDGGAATAEMLLKVGDYVDEQEILSGDITRKVGIMVLDGTENWQLATSTDLVQFYTSSTQGVIANNVSLYSTIAPYGCTVSNRTQYNFGCYSGNSGNLCFQMKGSATLTTSSAWTQFLTDQYNAGTPVIVVYPLNTPTTERVAGQIMNIQAGSNTIEIIQASIDNLGLYAKYKATA